MIWVFTYNIYLFLYMAEKKETSRLESFSDGVFAIAITLLILEIKVPPSGTVHSVNDLWMQLFNLWPSYVAFVYSFGTILIIWQNHHRVFSMINKFSTRFMYANGILLLTVTFIPFPTALLAQYIATEYSKPAIVFFCFSSVLNNLAFVFWSVSLVKPKRLFNPTIDTKQIAASTKSTWFGLLIYTLTTILAFWLPVIALLINCSLWFLWIGLSLKNYSIEGHRRV